MSSELHAALHSVRRAAMGYPDPNWIFHNNMGICYNVESWLRHYVRDLDLRHDLLCRMGNLIEKWEKDHHVDGRRYANTTHRHYPVGGSEEYHHGYLWNNPRRWALLTYLLEKTR